MTRAPSPRRELLFIRISVSIDQWPPRAFRKDVRNHRRGYYDVFMKYRGRAVPRKRLLSVDALLFAATESRYSIALTLNAFLSLYVIQNFVLELKVDAKNILYFSFPMNLHP